MSNTLALLPIYHDIAKPTKNNNEMTLYKTVEAYVTSYYIMGQYEALRQIATMNPESYILFVGYTNADMQPGITGTRLKFRFGSIEKASHAAIRELKEETGFTTHPQNLMYFDNGNCQKVGRYGTIYLTDAGYCTVSKYVKMSRNDSLSKVALLVYGSQTNVMRMIQKAKPIDPHENIAYYACVHIAHALEMTRIIKERRSCGLLRPFHYRM